MTERGQIVTLAIKGPYTSKPRPWLVIQSDAFTQTASITVCLVTASLIPGAPLFRIDIAPSEMNGLDKPSQVQIDKILTIPRDAITDFIGRLEDHHMERVEAAIITFLDLRRR